MLLSPLNQGELVQIPSQICYLNLSISKLQIYFFQLPP